jgi:hypothetical protein
VKVLFWLKSRFTKKPLVKGRPSVPSVPHYEQPPSALRIELAIAIDEPFATRAPWFVVIE